MRILPTSLTALLVLSALALTACSWFDNNTSSSTQPGLLAPALDSPIADIPVPETFTMVEPPRLIRIEAF